MKEARYFYVPDAANANELPTEEAMHALRVLRLKSGDEMFLMDGNGFFYKAEVTLAATKHCMYEIKEKMPQEKTWNGNIHIAMAPTKMMDRTEWFAEKATEIGVDELAFVNCKFSERKVMRTVRLDKIIVSAMKFIAHCYNEIESVDLFDTLMKSKGNVDDVTVLIGPEGDFSIDEVKLAIKNGYTPVSLGESRLRTETAALYATMTAQLVCRKE